MQQFMGRMFDPRAEIEDMDAAAST